MESLARQTQIYKEFLPENIGLPEKACEGFPKAFSKSTYQGYVFTTENISEYLKKLDLTEKKVACIAGSGDFAFNAYMKGAASIDAIDISPLACFFSELKWAGLSQLSYGEFLDFFATRGNSIFGESSFSYELYKKLQPYITLEARKFFDQLITREGRSPRLVPGGMIINKIKDMRIIRSYNPYLASKESYQQAQRALRPILFYPQDIGTFLKFCKGHYDLINLSNIITYHSSEQVCIDLMEGALEAVKEDGIVIAYFFACSKENLRYIGEFYQRWKKPRFQCHILTQSKPFFFVTVSLKKIKATTAILSL